MEVEAIVEPARLAAVELDLANRPIPNEQTVCQIVDKPYGNYRADGLNGTAAGGLRGGGGAS